MNRSNEFYMVLGSGMPMVRHPTHKAAYRTAHRMAKLHPGQEFFVLRSASSPIVYDDLGEQADASETPAEPASKAD